MVIKTNPKRPNVASTSAEHYRRNNGKTAPTCAVGNDVPKVDGKRLVFKASIGGVKAHLPVHKGNEAEQKNSALSYVLGFPNSLLSSLILGKRLLP